MNIMIVKLENNSLERSEMERYSKHITKLTYRMNMRGRMRLSLIFCLIKWQPISICFVISWKVKFLTILMVKLIVKRVQ